MFLYLSLIHISTFPAPVYAKWADTYQKETGNKVNYQGIGSSGGVKQIIACLLYTSEMGVLQERITSTKTGSITSVQAVYCLLYTSRCV